jgi:DnaJ family protein B protein 4
MEDYYEILGIEKNSTNEEIKKAYRKLSLLYHPDRPGGSQDKFRKINDAYETLSDSRKRKMYDLESSNPFINMSGNINPMDIFSKLFTPPNMNDKNAAEMFNQMDPMFPFSPGMGPKIHIFKAGGMPGLSPFPDFENAMMEEPDIIEINVELTMSESYIGCNKPIEINRYIVKNGKKSYETETLYVEFNSGVDNNEYILVREKGNMLNGVYGDIKIKVQLKFVNNYSRNGLDLIYDKYLSLNESLCGFSFLLEHINGKSYKINHNGEYIIQPNHIKEIPNLGFNRNNNTGKLVIRFNIVFPNNLSLEKRKQISNIISESNEDEKDEKFESID